MDTDHDFKDTGHQKQWSDDTCREISNLDRFPAHVLDLDVQKKVIERFLNFYLGGKVPKGLAVTDLMFSVISIMPPHMGTEDLLWGKQEYTENGTLYCLPVEDVQQAERNRNSELNSTKHDASSTIEHDRKKSESDATCYQISQIVTKQINTKSEEEDRSIEKLKTIDLKPGSSKDVLENYGQLKIRKAVNSEIDINDKNSYLCGYSEIGNLGYYEEVIDDTDHCIEKQNVNEKSEPVKNYMSSLLADDIQQDETNTNSELTYTKDDTSSTIKNERKESVENDATDHHISQTDSNQVNWNSKRDTTESGEKLRTFNLKPESSDTIKNYGQLKITKAINSEIDLNDKNSYLYRYSEIGNLGYYEELIDNTDQCVEKHNVSERSEPEKNYMSSLKILPQVKYFGTRNMTPPEPWRVQYHGPTNNAAFVSSCHKLLGIWDKDSKARIVLKFFFGIVALISMRGLTKTYKHVLSTFAGYKFQNYVNYINDYNYYNFQYCIPNKKYIGASHRSLKERSKNTIIIFAKIIISSLIIDDQMPMDWELGRKSSFRIINGEPLTVNFLKSAVLSHTANYKLELVNMVHTMIERLTIKSVNIAIEVTYCAETADSWRRLIKYINHYLNPETNSRTHPWARVIDEDYFQDLSCAENYSLAVILTVFEEKVTLNEGIWLSKWVDNEDKKEGLEKLKELGHKMFEELLSRDESIENILSTIKDSYYI